MRDYGVRKKYGSKNSSNCIPGGLLVRDYGITRRSYGSQNFSVSDSRKLPCASFLKFAYGESYPVLRASGLQHWGKNW